jgi:hypothetical protein
MAVKKRWLQSVEDAVSQEEIPLPWARRLRRAAAEPLSRPADDAADPALS